MPAGRPASLTGSGVGLNQRNPTMSSLPPPDAVPVWSPCLPELVVNRMSSRCRCADE